METLEIELGAWRTRWEPPTAVIQPLRRPSSTPKRSSSSTCWRLLAGACDCRRISRGHRYSQILARQSFGRV